MAGQDWSVEENNADLIVELELPEEIAADWNKPVPTVVAAAHRGYVPIGAKLLMRLVADPDARMGPDISVLPGERWRTCATLRDDGSIVPEDGTGRVAPSNLSPSSVP